VRAYGRQVRVPVFVSAPTALSADQETVRVRIVKLLLAHGLETRALGRNEYPTEYPLKEVAIIAKHCSGGVILGFEQFRSLTGIRRPGTAEETRVEEPMSFPTPWNHLEAGILFGLRLPLLIFRERGISGGVFDQGVTDVFIHDMPSARADRRQNEELQALVLKWQSRVREHYYRFE
jgi:hypothetical protein